MWGMLGVTIMTPMMEDKTKDKMKDKMKDEMKDEKSKITLVGQMPPRTMMMFLRHLMGLV